MHATPRAKDDASYLVELSKAMTYILRHQPPPGMDAAGWVSVRDIAKILRTTEHVLLYIAAHDIKHRGIHSHSTTLSYARWDAIQASGELRRMRRQYVHFALEARHLRSSHWATVFLALDVERALQEGHELWLAPNGVLLTPGPIKLSILFRLPAPPAEWDVDVGRSP